MGSGRAGMVALYRCCTTSSPTVLGVFWERQSVWRLAYSQVQRLIWQVKFRGRELVERSPIYGSRDFSCCPSHFRYYRLHYGHGQFRTLTGELVRGVPPPTR